MTYMRKPPDRGKAEGHSKCSLLGSENRQKFSKIVLSLQAWWPFAFACAPVVVVLMLAGIGGAR